MKIYIQTIVIAILIFISACKKDNNYGGTLTGKWKLAGSYLSAGGPMYYVPAIDNSEYVIFQTNGKIAGIAFSDFKFYTLKDSVTITLTSADNTTYENYRYNIKNDTLTMSPAGPNVCIEGCSAVFVR